MKTVDADRALKKAKEIASKETEKAYPNAELNADQFKTAKSKYYWSILYREFHRFMGSLYAC